MKKIIIMLTALVFSLFSLYYIYQRYHVYIGLGNQTPSYFMKTEGTTITMKEDETLVPFEIRGVDLGAGVPGEWATDYAIDKETYLRWFEQIQAMGANTIRIYTILQDDFYNAFYEYNQDREEPLYLIQGIWVNDYVLNSHRDAYASDSLQTLLDDCRTAVDILHGNKALSLGYGVGSGSYRKDVSSWVIGYIVGVEWETSFVTYTNQNQAQRNTYQGKYLYTTEEATPFEAFLAQVGDKLIDYESDRYHDQRLVAFANWPTTDPFVYPAVVSSYYQKVACVNVEHIKTTEQFLTGMFASYHVYSYYPDYIELMREGETYTEREIIEGIGGKMVMSNLEYRLSLLQAPKIEDYLEPSDYIDEDGQVNTYLAYLRALNRYHTIPVVISEYGVTTGRGIAQIDRNTGRNQGHMSEQEQGQALIKSYQDIMAAGSAGSCIFTWQDEWFKRTWNTMYSIDLDNTAYWSDYQTNEQFFGLLTFDPGTETSVAYVDGDDKEWRKEDVVIRNDTMELSMKTDEKFIYFMIRKDDFDPENDTIVIPIDTTPKSGSTYCEEYDVSFTNASDFLIVIHGKNNSRVLVQERYEVLMSTYGEIYYRINPYIDPPSPHSSHFKDIYMPLKLEGLLPDLNPGSYMGEKFPTGHLRYGNANPDDETFDSLADYIFGDDMIEIRIPWQLLNFSNPSEMMIHDDYYTNYGIENLHIEEMYVGIATLKDDLPRIQMEPYELNGWGKDVTYHERLKQSYTMLKEYWTTLDETNAK